MSFWYNCLNYFIFSMLYRLFFKTGRKKSSTRSAGSGVCESFGKWTIDGCLLIIRKVYEAFIICQSAITLRSEIKNVYLYEQTVHLISKVGYFTKKRKKFIGSYKEQAFLIFIWSIITIYNYSIFMKPGGNGNNNSH